MQTSEKTIQESYARALKNAKNNELENNACCAPVSATDDLLMIEELENNACCAPVSTTDDLVIIENEPQSISFGCIRLNDILADNLKTGDTVIDFGSGPGHDLFLAATHIGTSGRAIGVDFTDEMHEELQQKAKEKGFTNIELVKSNIDNINLPDNIADVIISNCVINLAHNKAKVFKEAYRLLKPGGLLIDADIIVDRDLPKSITSNSELWCNCIGGALTQKGYKQHLLNAGFSDIRIEFDPQNLVTFDNKEYSIFSGIIWAKKL